MKRKVRYAADIYNTSIPVKIARLLKLKKKDEIEYIINDDGSITIRKAVIEQ